MPAARVHDEARPLVDHQQVLVLVDDREAHGRSPSAGAPSAEGSRSARARSTTITSARIPSVIEASARLNGGHPSGSLTKSVTEPPLMRSITLPSAPPMSIPVGSQMSG